MVTFSLPGDGDAATSGNATPRSRPPLPFAKRAYAASPFGGSAKRLGTPQGASARKLLMRDDQAPNSLTKSNLASVRNIFRASTISDSPPAAAFSPSIPATTPKKVFAPGATPEPSRFRGSTAQATPRGVASKAKDKELFPMRIASPPKELTGETLARKVPKDWNPKGSIYADQFLADLCPPEFDEEQRRQFFCILDLRRLKYAADEIFSRKGWKLNVINFAKEFEKSRSIILLRYGLYEFQNVKPSKEVLKRWRREHGLPEPEEDEEEDATPSKPITKKRKANDDSATAMSYPKTRKVFEKNDEDEGDDAAPKAVPVPAPEPAQNKSKRKASVSEETEAQPFKMSKPSSASSLFQKIANKSASAPTSTPEAPSTTPKPNPFAAAKPAGSSLAKSVFSNLKAGTDNAPTNGNIFGHLSDSSAKNSGAEADEESEPDSDAEDSPEAAPSDGPSLAASGTADNAFQAGSSLFAPKSNLGSGFATAGSSAPGTRESTPGRSLFDRVTKNNDGQPVRAENEADTSATPKPSDQTWNPSTTPIKFAPSGAESNAQPKSLFGGSSATSGLSFPPKTSTTSSLFGNTSTKSDSEVEKPKAPSTEQDKTGGESDKENDSQPAKSIFGTKPTTTQPASGFLFQSQPAAAEPSKAAEASKPAANIFGGPSKPSESAASPAPQSSTLFGAKPTQAAPEPSKPLPAFGAPSNNASAPSSTPSLFGAKPSNGASNIFGNSSSTPSTNIFGAPKAMPDATQAKPADDKPSQPTPAPTFSFGSASSDKPNGLSQAASKPLFGAPKSPPSSAPTNSMFDGSPMKQDEASPAKRAFTGNSNLGSAPPIFSNNLFGASSAPAANSSPATSFGGAAPANDKPANTGFSFTSTASSGSSFNNPFAAGGSGETATPSFNFGATSTPAAGGGSFQFGGSNGNASQPGSSIFGNQSNETPKPMFGGNTGGAPVFSFGSNTSQPPANNGMSFGSNQANAPQGFAASLQPPTGGASTTGTNSPMFSIGGASSLGTTPAGGATPTGGTPEPSAEKTNGTATAEEEDGEKHEQINLTNEVDDGEEVLHEVRAKVLKFVPADKLEGDEKAKAKSKSPWSTQGVGPLRLLKNKETNVVRLLLRAEPRGHVALNRAVLPNMDYKSQEKYVKVTTSNEKGDGLEMWMIQTKTKDLAETLAGAMEEHKKLNEK